MLAHLSRAVLFGLSGIGPGCAVAYELVEWALHQSPAVSGDGVKTHPATARFILVALAELARPPHLTAFPSVPTLCEMTAYGRKTVQRALKDLEGAGLIVKVGDQNSAMGPIPKWKLNTTLKRNESERQAVRDRIEEERAKDRNRHRSGLKVRSNEN